MVAVIKFDQAALPAGIDNRSRSDIVAGTAVTITNVSPGTTNVCELLGKPTDDDTAVITGASPTWTITPKTATFGTYRIRLTVDDDVVIHTFTVRSPIRSLQIGVGNEGANPDANLADTDPGTWINESETNEGGHFFGWWPGYEELMKALDRSLPLIRDLVSSPSVESADEVAIYDDSESSERRVTIANLLAAAAGSRWSRQNKDMTASLTTSDGDLACVTAIQATPVSDGNVRVLVNGLAVVLGDGVKTKTAYFSGDGGTTARSIADVQTGDLLYWNGSIAKFQLASTDVIEFDYAESA